VACRSIIASRRPVRGSSFRIVPTSSSDQIAPSPDVIRPLPAYGMLFPLLPLPGSTLPIRPSVATHTTPSPAEIPVVGAF
jgi:hypothetical protein